MKHVLFFLLGLASIPAMAEMRPLTGTTFEHDGLRYAVVESDAPSVSIQGPVSNDIEMATVPETVTNDGNTYTVRQIESRAFEASPNLFLLKLPGTITDIGDYTFYNCPLLGFDELPEQLQTIGRYAFSNLPQLKKVTLPMTTETIGEGAFSENANLERATLFSAVKVLPVRAFASCPNLREVYLPEGLEELRNFCFSGDLSIRELVLPPGLKRIYATAIPGNASSQVGPTNLVIPNSVEYIEPIAFSSTNLISVNIGDGIEDIPNSAFSYCYALKDIKLPKNLKRIGEEAFRYCGANESRSITKVDIPSSVEEICTNAFYQSRILSISTGNGVKELPSGSLGTPRAVHLGSRVRNIESDAINMSELSTIICDAATPPVVSADFSISATDAKKVNLIVKDDAKALYEAHPRWNVFNIVGEQESIVEVTLDGTKGLGEAIYEASGILPSRVSNLTVHGTLSDNDLRIITENMYSLSSLNIGDTDIETIPAGMFMYFKTLTSIVLPAHLRHIKESAFSGCYSMKLEELPETLESIGSEAFLDCASITIDHFPESLRTVGYRAFSGCSSIRSMTANAGLQSIGASAFNSCDILEYADFSKTAVKEMDYTFYICRNLKTVLLPAKLEKLRSRTLAITNVESVEIPGTVTTLEKEVFYETPLRVLSLGENVVKIPRDFLSEAKDIVSLSLPASLKRVEGYIMPNSSKLRALSCRATTAPAAESGAFDGVPTQECTLTVPSQSFFSYLNAPQWGMFGHLENTLDVEITGDATVTILPEDEYEDIAANEEAKDVVAGYEETDEENEDDTDPKTVIRRARARQLSDLVSGKHFAALFNGAQLNSNSNEKGHRVFMNDVDLADIESVTLNGQDITAQMEGNSILLPSSASGQLKINIKPAGLATIEAADKDGMESWYTLEGIRMDSRPQIPGIYIHVHGNKTEKIIIK